MTITIKQKKVETIYYDQNLVARLTLLGRFQNSEGTLFIGGFFNALGVPGTLFDNVQVFSKALSADEITILALANKDSTD